MISVLWASPGDAAFTQRAERYEFKPQQGQWGLSSGEPGEAGVRKEFSGGQRCRAK